MRRHCLRQVGALLGVLALLLQMGVALAHDPTGLAALAPGLGLPLCHVASGDRTADPSQAPAAPNKSAICPLCLGLAAGAAFISPPAIGGVAIAASPQTALPHLPDIASPRHDRRGRPAQPRGPPTLA